MPAERRTTCLRAIALLGAVLAGACTSQDDGAIHFEMKTTLAPGLETQRCLFVEMPDRPMVVTRGTMSYTPGSHHVSVHSTPYTSRPTKDVYGNTVDTSGVFDCPHGGGDWETVRSIGASQSPEPVDIIQLPAGLGVKFAPKALILINAHYINASESPREVTIDMDLFGEESTADVQEPGALEFTNDYILVPPYGKSVARMQCPVTQATKLLEAQSHMHKRGTNFVLRVLDADGNEKEELYRNTDWDHVPIKHWPAGYDLKPGEFLEFLCEYTNPTEKTLLNGQTTEDEMCTLRGSYYPYDPLFDLCRVLPDADANSASVIVGFGEKTCGAVLPCLTSKKPPTNENGVGGEEYIACQQSTCPGVARQVSEFIHCQLRNMATGCIACAPDKNGPGSPECAKCIAEKCAPETAACEASACP